MHIPLTVEGKTIALISTLLSSALLANPIRAEESLDSYLDLPLEDLLSMEVTSVSKKKQRLTEAAAAIFVITQEDIRRSGVTSIPEALRMAPGLQVAKIDANKWAISSRGFSGQLANKLLVLMDGRSVYTPAYSGVYWDVQDTLLEDIDRIEVIRGPGATLWGANAVNGVINIITKYAHDSQGGLISIGVGDEEKGFTGFRYGADFNETTKGRFYAKYFDRDSNVLEADGSDAGDDWESLRAGFRIDGSPSELDNWTLQGDIYDTQENQRIISQWIDPTTIDPSSIDPTIPPGNLIPTPITNISDTIDNSGWNLLGRWNHIIDDNSSTTLQVYYDYTEREEVFASQIHDTLDIDFQHNLDIGAQQALIWGLGYRRIEDEFDNTYNVTLDPDRLSQDLFSAFIQDQIELAPETLFLTIGSKFEHNDYTGYEVQPSIRGLWQPDDKSSVWGSVSRAVRTPSRIERNGRVIAFSGVVTTGNPSFPLMPVTNTVSGSEDFESEKLLAYELGYRIQPRENLSLDLAAFYNDYDNLLTYETFYSSPLPVPSVLFDNKMSGHATGLEVAMDWRPSFWWRVQAGYTHINLSLDSENDNLEPNILERVGEGSSPEHQFSLRSSMDLTKEWELDLWVYYMDQVPVASVTAFNDGIGIDSYTSVNARLGWRPWEDAEFSLVGLNLQSDGHTEYVGEYFVGLTDIERSVYAKIRWDF